MMINTTLNYISIISWRWEQDKSPPDKSLPDKKPPNNEIII